MKKPINNQDDAPTGPASGELRDIKALLVLLLMKSGASQTEIAKALGTTQATVSRQFRLGTVKPLSAHTISADGRDS
jgi:IS30 family transposase